MATSDLEDAVRARLRQLRFERGLSVAALGAAAGLAPSTVSRLETGARKLTLAHVERLARALGVAPDELLWTEPPSDERGGGPRQSHDGRIWRPVGPQRTTGRRVYRVTVPVVPEPVAAHSHEGHQWIYVLDGSVRLVVEHRQVVLDAGAAAQFHTWRPHWMGAVDRPAEVLIVFSPEGEPLEVSE